ncbi:acyl-CoA thioesterase [Maritimibacter sp. 55A14]|uniref:acyl-CoA thioesterase n=1 Tax=Maritimibacter sp. 55A14 TaxID=2174844 RepID=UPI000D605CCE|nr:thioesterase family protein [Maritimibacter sp. 55A14]PWE34214.1 acyl-CoA thioesterase [Maritimibacter sp. 55A14]
MDLRYHIPLDRATLRAHGVPDDWPMGVADRVRFHELDTLGHVNNAAYLTWFENFRVHYTTAYGLTRGRPQLDGLVLRALNVDYRASLRLGEDYIVTGRTTQMRNTSFTMEYGVFSGDLKVLSTAVLVLVEADGTTKRPIPEEVRRAFAERDGAQAA